MCLTSFWQLDIFLITWHFFDIWATGHMGNGTHGQRGIMVNIKDRDGVPCGMGHMGNGAHDHNFLITAWIFTKILLDIDIDVFYLNILLFLHDGLFKHKNWWIWNSDWFQHWFHELVPLVPMSSYGTWPISLLSVGLSLRFFYWT